MATYIVTGGAGFIGSHIAEELVRRRQTVRIVDNFSTGKAANIAAFRGDVDVVEHDVALPGLEEVFNGADFVIHQAAIPSVPLSMRDPIGTNRVNADGTLKVLAAARTAGVKRVVTASSSAVYGDDPALPKRETMATHPISPYGAQKLISEIHGRLFWNAYGLETVSLRYFNVFGPRQDPSSQYSGVMAKFIPAVLEGRTPVIYGDGEQSRDFVYVANVVEANLLACVTPGISGEAFNIACGGRVTVNAMLAAINKATGGNVVPLHEAPREGDILHSEADIEKARTRMGYTPRVTFEDGLAPTIDWYRQ